MPPVPAIAPIPSERHTPMNSHTQPNDRDYWLAAALGAALLVLAAGGNPAYGAQFPSTIPGLPPALSQPAPRGAANVAQGDREFLQQIESAQPSTPASPAPIAEAPRDASTPTLAPVSSGVPEVKSGRSVAEQPAAP